MIEITTPRLVFKIPTFDDVDEIHAAKVKVWTELQKWMSWSSEENGEYQGTYDWVARAHAPQNDIPLIGRDRLTHAFVVSTGVHGLHPHFTTGYWVAEEFWGKGYATETCIAMVRYAFLACSAMSVSIDHYEDHEKSRRVIEKTGFEFVKVFPKEHRCHYDGRMLDKYHYTLTDLSNVPDIKMSWK